MLHVIGSVTQDQQIALIKNVNGNAGKRHTCTSNLAVHWNHNLTLPALGCIVSQGCKPVTFH